MKNILFDGKHYYLIRSLNDGNMQDLSRGIQDIRTDAQRYRDRNGEWGKYSDKSECSLEEVFDHIKMKYRKDTNCTSLTRNANVALTYHVNNSRYVLVRVEPDELDRYFDAGDYMLGKIETEISKVSEQSTDEIRELLDRIDKAESQEEIRTILSEYNENITQFAIRQKQYLAEEEQQRVDKTIAKLKVLEHNGVMPELVPGANNSFVVATMGNAYSSSEYISYGEIPREKVIDCPKFFLDVISLVHQVEDSGKYPQEIKNISAKLIELINQGYDVVMRDGQAVYTNGQNEIVLEPEAQFVASAHSSKDVLNKPLGVGQVYDITDGSISYKSATMQALGLKALSEMKLKKESIIAVLEQVLPEENVREVFQDTFCLNPAFLVRQNGRGHKVSETVNILISQNGNDLSNETTSKIISKLDVLPKETLIQIAQGTLPLEQLISLMEQEEQARVTERYVNKFGDYLDKKQDRYHQYKNNKEKYILEAIIDGVDWQSFGRTLTKGEKKQVIKRILPEAKELRNSNFINICNILQEYGFDDDCTFASVVNMAIEGKIGDVSYKELLLLSEEHQRKILGGNIDSLRQRLEPIDIDLLTQRGKTVAKLQERAKKLGVDEKLISQTDIRNLSMSLKIIEEYDFETAIGRSLTQEEQKLLIISLIDNRALSSDKSCYILTLINNLEQKGMDSAEAYGAIINYAIGNGNYTDVLQNRRGFRQQSKEKIVTEITKDTINQMLLNNGIQTNENVKKIEALSIKTQGVNVRNVDSAIKIVEEYDFGTAIGRSLTQEEQRVLIECLIDNSLLRENKSYYISVLMENLQKKGMSKQEVCGAIINYAIGNGSYTRALSNSNKFSQQSKAEITTEITTDTINQMFLNNGIQTEENIKKLERLGITAQGVDVRNVDSAIKIVEEYDFETAIGRTLSQFEQKTLIELLINNGGLRGSGSHYISTLVKSLEEKGMDREEAYGAVINYAIGNGSYTRALSNSNKFSQQSKAEITTEITTDTINQMFLNNGIQTEENIKKLERLGITAQGVDVRNVDSAIKIVEEYDFETAIGRTLSQFEQKTLIELLINNGGLRESGKNYISTLVNNLVQKGMDREEAYGAVINYAIGNGSYKDALRNIGAFPEKSKEEITTQVTEETLTKAAIKYHKKALKLARASVSKETVARKDETLEKLNGLVIETESQSVEQKQ